MPSYKPTGNLRWVKNHPKAEDGRLMLQQEMSDSQGGIRWDDVLVYDISECLDMTGGPPDPTQPPEFYDVALLPRTDLCWLGVGDTFIFERDVRWGAPVPHTKLYRVVAHVPADNDVISQGYDTRRRHDPPSAKVRRVKCKPKVERHIVSDTMYETVTEVEDPDPKTIVEAEIKKALIRSHNWKSGIVVSIRPLGSSYATGFVALVTWAGGNASEECHEPLCLGMSEEVLTVLAQYVAKKLSISLGKFLIEEGDKPIASINVQG